MDLEQLRAEIGDCLAALKPGKKENAAFEEFLAARPEAAAYRQFVEALRVAFRDAWLLRSAASPAAEGPDETA